MATKKNAAQTATTKETTVTIAMPEKFPNLATRIALHNEWFAIIQAASVEPTFTEVKNCHPNKKVSNLTNDPVEQAFLPYVCAYFGWGDELCTVAQAKECGGTLKDGAQGWPAAWLTTTTQSGPNAGKSSTWCQFIFPKEAYDWKDGEPKIDEEAIAAKKQASDERRARGRLRRAQKDAKELGLDPKTGKSKAPKTTAKAAPKAPAKTYKVTMPDGTVLEAPSIAELKELKEMFVA